MNVGELKQLVITAHKAGDIEKATKLREIYRKYKHLDVPQDRDNAFEYGIDQGQKVLGKGIEVVGRATGIPAIEQKGTQIVEQQDRDIAEGGYVPQYTGSLRDNYQEGGLGQAVRATGERLAEMAPVTTAYAGGTIGSAILAKASVPLALLLGGGTTIAGGVMGAGEAAFEQEEKLGNYDEKLATGQGILIGILERFGISKLIPQAKLKNITGKELVETLKKTGNVQAAKEVTKRMVAEGGTEVLQEGVSIGGAGLQGATYTQKELEDRAIDTFVLGTTNAGATIGAGRLVLGKPAPLSNRLVQATFAQRLDATQKAGDQNGKPFNLNDFEVGSRGGVVDLMDKVHSDISGEITNLEQDLKDLLNPNRKNLTSKEKSDRVKVKKMLQQARNKTKSVVGKSDFEILKRLVEGTPDGKRLINLVMESQEQTKIWNAGLKGGISKYTDNFSPLPQGNLYSGQAALTNAVRGLTFAGVAGATAGQAIPYQIGGVMAGRAIDAITGRRSKVKRYINRNKKNPAFKPVVGLGERDKDVLKAAKAKAKSQQEAEEKIAERRAKAFYNYEQGNPPTGTSPEGIYQRFTGMDRSGLEATIAEALADPNLDPSVRRDLESLVESMKYGEQVTGFSVRHIRGMAERNPETVGKRVIRPIEGENGLPLAIAQYGAENPAVVRGREANNERVQELIAELKDDNSVSKEDKENINYVLNELLKPLSDPVRMITTYEKGLINKGVPVSAVERYIGGYKQIVMQQQARTKAQNTPPQNPDGSPTPTATPTSPQEPTPPVILGADGRPLRGTTQTGGARPNPNVPVEPDPPLQGELPLTPKAIVKPTQKAVKKALKAAKSVVKQFDIGKKGGLYQDGVATVAELRELAEALNLTVYVSNSVAEMKATDKKLGERYDPNRRGYHLRKSGQKGIIHVKNTSDLQFLITFAHEVSHALESRKLNYKNDFSGASASGRLEFGAHPKASKALGTKKPILENSWRELIQKEVAENKHSVIKAEIDKLQDQLNVFVARRPSLGTQAVRQSGYRDFYQMLADPEAGRRFEELSKSRQDKIKKEYLGEVGRQRSYRQYKKNSPEFAVDPVWVYLINPTFMKENLPETSAAIQKFFNQDKSHFPVTFQANPVVTILAIIMAGIAAREGYEEEEENEVNQPPSNQPLPENMGILSV